MGCNHPFSIYTDCFIVMSFYIQLNANLLPIFIQLSKYVLSGNILVQCLLFKFFLKYMYIIFIITRYIIYFI